MSSLLKFLCNSVVPSNLYEIMRHNTVAHFIYFLYINKMKPKSVVFLQALKNPQQAS